MFDCRLQFVALPGWFSKEDHTWWTKLECLDCPWKMSLDVCIERRLKCFSCGYWWRSHSSPVPINGWNWASTIIHVDPKEVWCHQLKSSLIQFPERIGVWSKRNLAVDDEISNFLYKSLNAVVVDNSIWCNSRPVRSFVCMCVDTQVIHVATAIQICLRNNRRADPKFLFEMHCPPMQMLGYF